MIQIAAPLADDESPLLALAALLRSAEAECPQVRGQVVALDAERQALPPTRLSALLEAESLRPEDRLVRHRSGIREVHRLEDVRPDAPPPSPWRDGGVYLFSGGAGGLGRIFARHIASQVQRPTLLLLGRSQEGASQRGIRAELEGLGARVEYHAVDVADAGALTALVRDAVARLGGLAGVLHAAGVLRDAYLLRKDTADLDIVLAPKIAGALALDEATRDMDLDFFALFSSLAGVMGGAGQADYAFANAWLDGLAGRRANLVSQGLRRGRTLAMDWPLWADGGMAVDEAALTLLRRESGMVPMPARAGLDAFHTALASGHAQVLAAWGERQAMLNRLRGVAPEILTGKTTGATGAPGAGLRRAVLETLRQTFAEITGRAAAAIDAGERLEAYGLDSILVGRMNERLSRHIPRLSRTVLYEYNTLDSLAGHLLDTNAPACAAWCGLEQASPAPPLAQPPPAPRLPAHARHQAPLAEPVAIIGAACQFPQAPNLETFFANMEAGRDCVGQIPAERWSLVDFFEPDRTRAACEGRSYSKWGAFLDGFADFDPLFFGISPREAMCMDPQERLFLTVCWRALEDAGLTRERLAKDHKGRVGVFAGITKTGYERHAAALKLAGSDIRPRTSFAAAANRVSHFLDIHGPSQPVDTMCSSSLTAIHQACQSLRQGECSLALAGGVNLYLHPSNYVDLCATGMLSHDGRCRSFGQGGSGFVPGEGAGVVALKLLSRAEADGDRILALLRATAVNHGGHAGGFTVPNPAAQAALIRAVLNDAGAPPASISCVEAHGTGTELGDPIEAQGLALALGPRATPGRIALGSAKSAIGHLEAAAGVAGVIKVLGQLRRGVLAPTLHADEPNQNIDWTRSPLRLIHRAEPWLPPDGGPRRALVNSFGAGGANACVLVEEYPQPTQTIAARGPWPVVLSARSDEALRRAAEALLAWLSPAPRPEADQKEIAAVLEALGQVLGLSVSELEPDVPLLHYGLDALGLRRLGLDLGCGEGLDLGLSARDLAARQTGARASLAAPAVDMAALAATLQTGREAMDHRLGLLARDAAHLAELLDRFLAGTHPDGGIWTGIVSARLESRNALAASEDLQQATAGWVERGRFADVLALWVRGVPIPWPRRPELTARRPLGLPGHPLAKRRFWVGDLLQASPQSFEPFPVGSNAPQHQPMSSRQAPAATEDNVRAKVAEELCRRLDLLPADIAPSRPFADYGLDSILCVGLVEGLNASLGTGLTVTDIFDHSTLDRLAGHILSQGPSLGSQPSQPSHLSHLSHLSQPAASSAGCSGPDHRSGLEPIAVIGMSGRYPGAPDLNTLWEHIRAGRELMEPVTRWPLEPGLCPRGGFLDGIDRFDALFFNISGIEAASMDPQQRVFLEQCWAALEDAGHAGPALAGRRCGVYAGCCSGDYQDLAPGAATAQSLCGNMASLTPARIAYLLDLKGPALAVDTACSSSLAAIHQACQALRQGETDLALAGGVFIQSTPRLYRTAGLAGMLSPTGRCRSFDQRADGFVPGEGAGALVLRRLADALADGDHIHGLILASGMNHDGTTNGITAPSARSQETLLRDVHARSGVLPGTIGLLEAHGTGTALGDPIEFRALSAAFSGPAATPGGCSLGSIKANIGHAQYAAGVAGVLKALLCLRNGETVPLAGFEHLNPGMSLKGGPFRIDTAPQPWRAASGLPRRAAVSAFGASGTNVHLVLEEAPTPAPRLHASTALLFALSARRAEALPLLARRLALHLRAHPGLDLADVSFTLLTGRGHFEHRLAFVAQDHAALVRALDEFAVGQAVPGLHCAELLPGAPSASAPAKRHDRQEYVEAWAKAYVAGAAPDVTALFPATIHEGRPRRVPLPTYPFAQTRHWIVPKPDAVAARTGFVGNVAAFRLRRLAEQEEQARQNGQGGQAVFVVEIDAACPLLADHHVSGQAVLPGMMAVELFHAALEQSGLASSMSAPWDLTLRDLTWLRPMQADENGLTLRLTLTRRPEGGFDARLDQEGAPAPCCQAVLLSGAAEPLSLSARLSPAPAASVNLSAEAAYDMLRTAGIAHGPRLRPLAALRVAAGQVWAELRQPEGAPNAAPGGLDTILMDGAVQAVAGFMVGRASVSATSVPFGIEHASFSGPLTWPAQAVLSQVERAPDGSLRRVDVDIFDDQGVPRARIKGMRFRPLPEQTVTTGHTNQAELLVPVWEPLTGDALVPQRLSGAALVLALAAPDSARLEGLRHIWSEMRVFPVDAEELQESVVERLAAAGAPRHMVLDARAVTAAPDDHVHAAAADQDDAEQLRQAKAWPRIVARVVRALTALGWEGQPLDWTVLTAGALCVDQSESCRVEGAALHGLLGSLAKEYPHWSVRLADFSADSPWPPSALAEVPGLPGDTGGASFAHRHGFWHRHTLARLARQSQPPPLAGREGGVYLVVGGAGGLGRVWSEAMLRRRRAQVVWLGRRSFNASIEAHIETLAALGPRPVYIQADASDRAALGRVREAVQERFGRLDGIVLAAIDLRDMTVARLTDEALDASLRAKADVALLLGQVFDLAALDFVLIFSSLQSFARMPGQGAYAAGCTLGDALAHNLRHAKGARTAVMHWGYWAEVGAVATQEHRERMARLGLAGIDHAQGVAALDTLLTGRLESMACAALAPGAGESGVTGLRGDVEVLAHEPALPPMAATAAQGVGPQEEPSCRLALLVGGQMSDLDADMGRFLYAQLQDAGIFAGAPLDLASMAARIPAYLERWLEESLHALARLGLVERMKDGRWRPVAEAPGPQRAAADWDRALKPWREDPHRRHHIRLAEATLMALPDILAGKRKTTEIIFPGASLRLVQGVYSDNAVADHFNDRLCDALVAAVNERLRLDPGARLRLLEVGAGTGGTTRRILSRLSPYAASMAEYAFTDLSKAFLLQAQRELQPGAAYLTPRLFDVSRPLQGQDIEPGGYDMVIATNVLHATRDIRQSLRNVKAVLKGGGLLMLNELSANVLFSHVTFGLLEGWWLYSDPALRLPGTPALAPETWARVLADEGFTGVTFPASPAHGLGQQIILADSDGLALQEVKRQPVPLAAAAASPAASLSTPLGPSSPLSSGPHARTLPPHTGPMEIPMDTARRFLRNLVAQAIQVPEADIAFGAPLERYGVDSILVLRITSLLRRHFPEVSSTLLFEANTVDALTRHVRQHWPEALAQALGAQQPEQTAQPAPHAPQPLPEPRPPVRPARTAHGRDIAIVGLSLRAPDAPDAQTFWANLLAGRDSIREIPAERFDWRAHYDPRPGLAGRICSQVGGFMDKVDCFEPLFFHISPAEALRMDPQERLFLEECYKALEDAGFAPSTVGARHKVGVFAGAMNAHYPTGAAFWSIANRVSYLLDLKGPSLAVDTACSSSLTAIHLAVQSLRGGECDMALAGGVNVIAHPRHMAALSELSILSPGGPCRSFGAGADGIAVGEAVAALVLRPLDDAEADGDAIYGVIAGTALNAGGRTSSYTAPSPSAQAALVRDAWRDAGIAPSDIGCIGCIEAHGTGTELGDPIEVEALTRAFGQGSMGSGCALGSVKSNIGHCESAAGAVGLAKVLLQLAHGVIAPSLHCSETNPHIDFAASPFFVPGQPTPWPRPESGPRLAGVSSFGAGGAGAHVLVREFAQQTAEGRNTPPAEVLLVLSARTPERLRIMAGRLAERLRARPLDAAALADLAWTLQDGREAMEHRLALAASNALEAAAMLEAFALAGNSAEAVTGNAEGGLDDLSADHDFASMTAALARRGELRRLGALWTRGATLDWLLLTPGFRPRRTHAPTYPFAGKRYWLQPVETALAPAATSGLAPSPAAPEPQPVPVAVPAATDAATGAATDAATDAGSAMLALLEDLLCRHLGLEAQDIESDHPLEEYGLDSVRVLQVLRELEERLGPVPLTVFYEHRTLGDLAAHLAVLHPSSSGTETIIDQAASAPRPVASAAPAPRSSTGRHEDMDIAIVGVAGRYPMAKDIDEYWDNLRQGRDCLSDVPTDRWDHGMLYDPDRAAPGSTRCRRGGFLDGVDLFDAAFFSILPSVAETTDPQERLFLECAYHAMENAGHHRDSLDPAEDGRPGREVGVFVGVMYEDYPLHGVEETMRGRPLALSGSPASVANRVSYSFDFRGPSLGVDTMCSSSHMAIHLACQSLRLGECRAALAGGVNLSLHPNKYRILGHGSFESAAGRCAAFGDGADGYVPSEGVGVVVLRPLDAALRDGDRILAVLRGSAVNHGGHTNGYTVPDPSAQARVIVSALSRSGLDPDTVSYVETHGTGTSLGDPIEIAGLMRAYGKNPRRAPLPIGSAKSAIGHCESAAGIASVTKVLLQMKHGELAPTLHADPPNRHIDFAATPFVVQKTLGSWPRLTQNGRELPRRAGISSYGAGGANAHLVLEERIEPPRHEDQNAGPQALVLSARTATALAARVSDLRRALDRMAGAGQAEPLADIAFTLQMGREAMAERLGFVAASLDEARDVLAALAEGRPHAVSVTRGLVRGSGARGASVVPASAEAAVTAFVEGRAVDWKALHSGLPRRRVALPGYPFERKSYWAPQALPGTGLQGVGEHDALFCMAPLWLDAPAQKGMRPTSRRVVLTLGLRPGAAEELAQTFNAQMGLQPGSQGDRHTDVRELGADPLDGANAVANAQALQRAAQAALATLKDLAQGLARGKSRAPLTVQFAVAESLPAALALNGLAGTAAQESPLLQTQTVFFQETVPAARMAALLDAAAATPKETLFLHRGGLLQVRGLAEAATGPSMSRKGDESPRPWTDGGVYLLTGGAGGLGLLFAQEIAAKTRDSAVVLAGRSPLDDKRRATLETLRALGLRAEYHAVDVSDIEAGTALVAGILERHGRLDGVLHGAGVLRDGLLLTKSPAALDAVLAPKVLGAAVLDEATRNLDLDFFACFASLAGVKGNAGQADYALANGWLDGFAAWRNGLVAQGLRRGRTVSLDWPLWAGGGMTLDEKTQAQIRRSYGLATLPAAEGMRAFALALASDHDQMLVAYGDVAVLRRKLLGGVVQTPQPTAAKQVAPERAPAAARLETAQPARPADQHAAGLASRLSEMVAGILRVSPADVATDSPLGEYGFDSITFTQLAKNIEDKLGAPVTPSLFFVHQSIDALAAHFATNPDFAPVQASVETSSSPAPAAPMPREDAHTWRIRLTGDDPFLRDHRIGGVPVLPGAAYLDLALKAAAACDPAHGARLAEVRWESPFRVDADARELVFSLEQRPGGVLAFEAASHDGRGGVTKRTVHARGLSLPGAPQQQPRTGLAAALQRTGGLRADGARCREVLSTLGLDYGPSHQGLVRVQLDGTELLGELSRPAGAASGSWRLDPGLMDAAFQATLGLLLQADGDFGVVPAEVPFELAGLEVFGLLPDHVFVLAAKGPARTDISLCAPDGTLLAAARGFLTFAMARPQAAIPAHQPALRPVRHEARHEAQPGEPVAIIGMSGAFPQAPDLDAFWSNLLAGRDCIGEIPPDRWDWRAIHGDPSLEPGRTDIIWGGFMDDIDRFDPEFFGLSRREALCMDPGQRLTMLHSVRALEDAGIAPHALNDSDTGLFIGTATSGYDQRLRAAGMPLDALSATGGVGSLGPNRVSHFLGLHGPSEPVETACSSSLVALHRAVRALQGGECGLALAGGLNVIPTAQGHISLSQAGLLSRTGRCRAFSSQADGYVRGEGAGLLVLKPLSRAEADGDPIHGLILATGVNHGGRAHSLTAPNAKAQAALIAEVHARAGIDPRTVGFIEAHGTGTRLGDPAEIEGLRMAFEILFQRFGATPEAGRIAIASLKTHIGHLELASGVASVIKTLLQMRHRTLIGNLHAGSPNPLIRLAGGPFYLLDHTAPWTSATDSRGQAAPLRAGVSSFGFGGVNAHIVLEDYQRARAPRNSFQAGPDAAQTIVLSAPDRMRLDAVCHDLLSWLARQKPEAWAEGLFASMAWTLQTGRDAHAERLAFVAKDHRHAADMLRRALSGEQTPGVRRGRVQRAAPVEVVAVGSLEEAALAFVQGQGVDWAGLAGLEQTGLDLAVGMQRTHLPPLRFALERFWVESPAPQNLASEPTERPAAGTPDPSTRQSDEPAANARANTSAQAGAQDPAEALRCFAAELCGMPAEEVDLDTGLRELGLDSIAAMRLASRLKTLIPGLDLDTIGDALLGAGTLADMLRAATGGSGPAQAGPQALALAWKSDPANQAMQDPRLLSRTPLAAEARLLVNQGHPFFFDHALDHVSGLHLAEAMAATAKAAFLAGRGLPPETPLFLSELTLAFPGMCALEPAARVEARCEAPQETPSLFLAHVEQEGHAVATASLRLEPLAPCAVVTSLHTANPKPLACEAVNKARPENVLLSSPRRDSNGRLRFALLLPAMCTWAADFPGNCVDAVVLAEAARQTLRAGPAMDIAGGVAAMPTPGVTGLLRGIEVRLTRPLQRTEATELVLDDLEVLAVGATQHVRTAGRVLVSGSEAGTFSASALAVSSAVHQAWR
ncbi:SDR family NAD(P)-dependent oxidoreductase [Humidesulfovibrio idahonensis]